MATHIAAQMYTLRDHCQTPADIAKTCSKLRDLGFTALQASAAGFSTIVADELKTILDDTGMTCCATHRNLEQLSDPQAAIDYHQTLGCPYTSIGGFGFGGAPKADWEAFVQQYNQIAAGFADSPVQIGYHNHSHELAPFALEDAPDTISPEHNPMTMLVAELNTSVWFEIDTYWIAHGGADPAAWIERLAGRVPCIHVKDITVSSKGEHVMCEVGAGNLNWPRILEAAKAAGTQWYIIERDRGALDPFDSLKMSLDNLKAMGVS